MKRQLPENIYKEMIEWARKGFPNEACGLLAKDAGGRVAKFYAMRNLDESSISYFMDPKEQLKIFKDMREEKLELAGIFHSHVSSEAYPSQKDIRLAFYPDVSYLIVSLSDMEKPVLRSFLIQDEQVTEEEIQIV